MVRGQFGRPNWGIWMFVKKRGDDAGVSARTRHGTTIKWSSTLVRRWGDSGWG